MMDIMVGESAGKLFQKLPLSNNTISRRIQHMAVDLNDQLIEKIKEKEFGLQLDEATGNKDAHLICYVLRTLEDLLFCKNINAGAKAQDLFQILDSNIHGCSYGTDKSRVSVEQTDDFPKVACITCTKKVKSAMIIRKQIIRSHRTLMEEKLAKKNQSNVSKSINTKVSSSESCLNHTMSTSNIDKEGKIIAPEIILLKVENDLKLEQEEEIVLISTPIRESNMTYNDQQINNKLNEKNIQNLPIFLDEISIIRINKSNVKEAKMMTKVPANVSGQVRKGLKPRPINSMTTNVQVPKRRTSKISFRPVINVEPPKRRGPTPKPLFLRYNPLTPVPCKICQKPIQKTNMKKHLETHDNKIVTCHLCGKVTKSTSLRAHIFYFHKCKEDEYVCDQCGRHFRYRNKFKLHMKKEHGGTKDFECTICGRKFFEKKYLTKHIDCHHKKIRPFICDYCGKDFSTKHALKVHLRQHTESAPYSCGTCGLRFKQNVSLKTHRKQAHDIYEEETVFCEVCGKGFASIVALSSHFRLHERKKCVHCSAVFVRDDYLERHIKDKHGTIELNSKNDDIESIQEINLNQDILDNVDIVT